MKIYVWHLAVSQGANKEIRAAKLELSVQLDGWTFSNCSQQDEFSYQCGYRVTRG